MRIAAAGQVPRPPRRNKYKRHPGEVLAVDGGTLIACPGNLNHWPISSKWLRPCPRCGVQVCRICAEDGPHAMPSGETCELPPGIEPVLRWQRDKALLEPAPGRTNPFDKDEDGNFISLRDVPC
jgi:hypothetical protein